MVVVFGLTDIEDEGNTFFRNVGKYIVNARRLFIVRLHLDSLSQEAAV